MVSILKIYFGDIMSHLKSCSRCGRIHPFNYRCNKGWELEGDIERKLRRRAVWDRKSKEIREVAGWLCELCKHNGAYSCDGLSTHHIVKIRDDPEKYLDNLNLIALCRECHDRADRGEIKPSLLFELARKRESEFKYY